MAFSFRNPIYKKEPENTTQPPKNLMSEQTRANSSLYEDYDLQPYNPDPLYQKKGDYQLFDDMLRDDQIAAVLNLKKLMIIDSQWEIEVEGLEEEGEGGKKEEAKNFLEWQLREGMDEIFEKKLLNILTALGYGFSLSELIWDITDEPEYKGKIILSKLKTRPPHTFEFDQNDYGDITMVRQDVNSGEDLKIKLEKFIHYSYQGNFDNPYGESELNEGVYRAWWSKANIIKFWNIYLERYGSPTVVGTYGPNMIQHKEDLKKVLKNIQAKSSITIPEGVLLDLLEKTGSGETDFERAIQFFNMSIARKMLIPDLLGFGGKETQGGSYSLGQEHFGIFYAVIEQIKKEIENMWNRYVIQPLTTWNFGNDIKAKFKFSKVDEEKKIAAMTVWLEAVKTGEVPVTNTHINWMLSQLDMPEIEESEFEEMEAKAEEEKAQMQEAMNGGIGQSDKPDKGKGNPKAKDSATTKDAKPEKVGKSGKKNNANSDERGDSKQYKSYWRPLTSYEKKTDFRKIESDTTRITDKYIEVITPVFSLMINGLVDDIKRKKIVERKRFDMVNKLDLRHQQKLKVHIKNMMKESYKSGFESVEMPRKDYAVPPELGLNNDDIAEWVNEKSVFATKAETDYILKKVKPILFSGIKEGKSIKEMIKGINATLKGYDAMAPHRTETMVRTTVHSAYNEARRQQYIDMGDLIVGYFYSAILDGRTSDICLSLDSGAAGVYNPDEAMTISPPSHFQCRSLLVPVFKDEEVDKWGKIPGSLEQRPEDGDFWRVKK